MGQLQIVGLIRELKLRWPLPVEKLFDFFSMASSPTELVLSLDCEFDDSGGISFFYLKSLFMAILPLVTLCLLSGYWFGIHNCVRKWRKQYLLSGDEVRSRLVICSLVFLFFMQSSLSKQAFKVFTCMQIGKAYDNGDGQVNETGDGGYIGWYLVEDLSIKCDGKEYDFWRYTVGIGSVLLYSLGIPLTTFFLVCEFAALLG